MERFVNKTHMRVSLSPQTCSRRHNPKLTKLGIENTSEVIKHGPFPANMKLHRTIPKNSHQLNTIRWVLKISFVSNTHISIEVVNINLFILSC